MILQPIDRNEALRYLGCKDGTDNEQMLAMLDSCGETASESRKPEIPLCRIPDKLYG